LLKKDRKEIRNIYIFAVLSGILSLGLPLGIQSIINFIQLGQLSASWMVLVGLVVLAIGFAGILNIYQMRITENLQQKIFTRSAFEFADRLPKINMSELLERYAPELTNRFFDTLTIQKGLSKLLLDFTAASLQVVFGLILLSMYHSFFIILGVFLVGLLVVIIRYTANRGFVSSMEESKSKYKIANWLLEIAHARVSFKMAGHNRLHVNKTDKYLNEYLNAREKHFKVLVQQYSFLIAFKVIIALTLLLVGGLLVLNQQMNIGQFVASEIIILLVLSSVEKIILSIDIVYDVITAIEKVGEVTDLKLETTGGRHPNFENENGFRIKLNNISYQPHCYISPILTNVSINIQSNEIISVISDSSVSPNTLFSLIGGLYETDEGSLSVNDLPITNIDKISLRDSIGTILQQDKLIHASLFENISFGREKVSINSIMTVAKQVGLDRDLEIFKSGFDTMINPEGHFIPEEVIQKILLVRAIVHQPKLLLIENPTDRMKEKCIQSFIEVIQSLKNCTILLATADEEILKKSNRIICIKSGQIDFEGDYSAYINTKKSC
jgi:ABC-type bacteriocin/lantibiotic exporter with double-glycine peptidase domain